MCQRDAPSLSCELRAETNEGFLSFVRRAPVRASFRQRLLERGQGGVPAPARARPRRPRPPRFRLRSNPSRCRSRRWSSSSIASQSRSPSPKSTSQSRSPPNRPHPRWRPSRSKKRPSSRPRLSSRVPWTGRGRPRGAIEAGAGWVAPELGRRARAFSGAA